MDKIKVYSNSSSGYAKGSYENPYTRKEYDDIMNSDADWPGGFVEGIGYVAADTVITGSSSLEDSWEDSSYSNPWEGSSSDDIFNSPGSGSSSSTGGGNHGNTGGGSEGPAIGSVDGSGNGKPSGNGGGNNITLSLGTHTDLSAYTQKLLKGLNGYSGKIVVTSTMRTPEQQARTMLNNIKRTGVARQKEIYGNYGDKVIDTYNSKLSDSVNIANMLAKIYELGPFKVSHHCMTLEQQKKLNVLDVSASQLSSKTRFKDAIESLNLNIRILDENGCVHLEIPQP